MVEAAHLFDKPIANTSVTTRLIGLLFSYFDPESPE